MRGKKFRASEARGEGQKAGEVGKVGLFKCYRDYSLEAKL